ncbi:hypothetical protein ACHAXA_005474 [Cyclostephanos tholiformis]|uniref:Uncharacterized protein n=1 Tax=Cyclostephanos tholiformis TaxID=382380 RepID=A0ABD3SH40_9STRA
MAIMLENMRKRSLDSDDASDLGSSWINKHFKLVLSNLPSFEPIPTSEISMEYQVGQDRDQHHRAPSSLMTPSADDYANLLFYESSDEDETTTSDAIVDGPPPVIVATEPPARGKAGRGSRRVSFASSLPTVHHLIDVPTARDMTPDEVSNLWISRSDLQALKSDAHSRVQDARDRILASERGGSSGVGKDNGGGGGWRYGCRVRLRSFMNTVERESDASIRGLEHRLFRRLRQTRQKLTRDVLECQAHVTGLQRFGLRGIGGTERAMLLARVSRERSVKARKLAFVDAIQDRVDVLNDCR